MVAAPALWSPLGSLCGPAAASERCLTSVRRCSPRNIARAACSGPLAAACFTFFFAMRRMYDARGEGAGALPTRAATGRFARDHGSCKRPCFLFVVGRLPVRCAEGPCARACEGLSLFLPRPSSWSSRCWCDRKARCPSAPIARAALTCTHAWSCRLWPPLRLLLLWPSPTARPGFEPPAS